MTDFERTHRTIVSFVRRSSRMNQSQRQALARHAAHYLVDVPVGDLDTSISANAHINWATVFGNDADLVVEIGSGMGESLTSMAVGRPDQNIVAFEVFEPAVASTVGKLAREGIENVRIVLADGAQGLRQLVGDAELAELWTFFADPWHKTRHHKRRLVSREFGDVVATKLRPGGVWRLATDWEDYALWMREQLDDHPLLENLHDGWAPRLAERPVTKYEQRGLDAGRRIFDLTYGRRA